MFIVYTRVRPRTEPYTARAMSVQMHVCATRGPDRFVSIFFSPPRRVPTSVTMKSSLPRTELAAGPADACQKPLMVVAILDGDAVTTDAIAACSLPAPEPTPSCCCAAPAAAGPTWSAAVALVTSVSTLTERRLRPISAVRPCVPLRASGRYQHAELIAAVRTVCRCRRSSRKTVVTVSRPGSGRRTVLLPLDSKNADADDDVFVRTWGRRLAGGRRGLRAFRLAASGTAGAT